mmetsp:Transcript_75794/g.190642  ORF Transcript_75794/g.190642 Transcript_75794/m.190642 type:complete len:250 (-) Transcript_75794:2153-2902(-)
MLAAHWRPQEARRSRHPDSVRSTALPLPHDLQRGRSFLPHRTRLKAQLQIQEPAWSTNNGSPLLPIGWSDQRRAADRRNWSKAARSWRHRTSGDCRRGRPQDTGRRDALGLCSVHVELCRFVPEVNPSKSVTSGLLSEHGKDAERLDVVRDLRLDDLALLRDYQSLPDQLQQLGHAIHTIELEVDMLLVILLVIKGKVIYMDAQTIVIARITLEGMRDQRELDTQAHHCPVLETKLGEKRLTVGNVGDI